MRAVLTLAIVLLSPVSAACSFIQPMPVHFDASSAKPGEVAPLAPKVKVASVARGNADDPNDSCGDTGVVVLAIPANPETKETAYSFDLVSGEADDVIFQPGPASGFEDEETGNLLFVFPWLDGASNKQEPLNLVVRVTPYRRSGLAGEPVEILVTDPGR